MCFCFLPTRQRATNWHAWCKRTSVFRLPMHWELFPGRFSELIFTMEGDGAFYSDLYLFFGMVKKQTCPWRLQQLLHFTRTSICKNMKIQRRGKFSEHHRPHLRKMLALSGQGQVAKWVLWIQGSTLKLMNKCLPNLCRGIR